MWPGDDLINFKFLGVSISSLFVILIPLLTYFATTTEAFSEITLGICEAIQEIIFITKMLTILMNRRELKDFVMRLEKAYEGFLICSLR